MQDLSEIFKKGCLVSLNVSCWGGRLKIPKGAIEVDADDDFYNAVKYLVDRKALQPIERIRSEARVNLYNKSLPFPISGVAFVPRDMISLIDEQMVNQKAKFEEKVGEFCEKYNTFRDEAREKLGSLYNERDYPSNISNKFGFSWQFFAVGLPNGKSSLLSPEVYEREKQKFQQQMKDFAENAVKALRLRFQEMLKHIVERLSGAEKKVFRDSLIEGPRKFIEDFNALNICDDKELEELIVKTKMILDGVSPDSLREDADFRNNIAEQVANVETNLSSMIVKRPRHLIIDGWDDDEEEE